MIRVGYEAKEKSAVSIFWIHRYGDHSEAGQKAQKKRAGTVDDPDRRGSHDRDRNLSCD